ncbi:protein LEO1 homolog isoform X2 [Olea europaea var. sylvestris]|uniref:protein LEO1 homolog isoform X2 n=1 Tax=Olea europaea var. sylvestris TaxID=158386 RepID=UPI000C1CF0C0|nr:protein LEO1 homolog isoform X2 [Olea europaea var. sylvestris]
MQVESNARLVTWEDGSLQLLIGEQAFMVSELDTRENQAHLFQRHKNGILQSQGRISKKLQFLPASDSQFSAILDATRNKNVKVKSCTADVISQWELENKKKMEKQTYRPNKRLGQMGKGIHKCGQIVSQEHRVPPGLLKDLMDYEQDFREQQSAAQHLNENRENEAGASVFTFNGKKGPKSPLKLSFPDAKSSQGPEDLLGSRKMVDK